MTRPALVLWLLFGIGVATGAERPPNFVIMLADDLGWRDLGCYGSTFYETPALDRLATQSVRFTQAYAASPVCSPSRAAFYTGKSPARLNITAHVGAPQPEQWRQKTILKPAHYLDHLPLKEQTFAEALHDAGYATLFAGKWHLGNSDAFWPEHQGFDRNLGGTAAGGPFSGKGYFSPYGNPRISDGPAGEHLDDRLASETVRFIESHRQRPFAVVLAFYSVHVPLMAPESLLLKYEKKQKDLALTSEQVWGDDLGRRVRKAQDHAVYGAMVEKMDQAVSKVLDAIDQQGLADNTIVIFTSDNGGLSTGDCAIAKDQGWPTSNAPLRAGKGWLYEGGLAVPLIVRAPGSLPRTVCDSVVLGTDIYPSILELAKLKATKATELDGQSFAECLQGKSRTREPAYWHYPHYSNQGGRPGAAIRDGDWKLIKWFETDDVELYDLNADRGETKNLSEIHTAVRDRLAESLNSWLRQVAATVPAKN